MVDFGKPAQFTCSYEGNPVKTVYWMKDGAKIGMYAAVWHTVTVSKLLLESAYQWRVDGIFCICRCVGFDFLTMMLMCFVLIFVMVTQQSVKSHFAST